MFLAGPCSVTVPMSLPRRTSKPSAEQPQQPQQQQEAGRQTEHLPQERRDEERLAGPEGDGGLPWLWWQGLPSGGNPVRRQTAEGRRTLLNPCHQFRIGTMSSMHRIKTSFYRTFKVLEFGSFGFCPWCWHTHRYTNLAGLGRGRTRDECDTVQFKEMCKSGVQTVSLSWEYHDDGCCWCSVCGVISRASNEGSRRFHNHGEGPY